MRVHSLLHGSRANGPGLRSVLWVQGCVGLECSGCVNPGTHDPNGGTEIDLYDLAQKLADDAPEGTEGITLSGGEPLQQSWDVLDFIREIKAWHPEWTVGLFTGYSRAELCKIPAWLAIRATLDFAVFGRYDRTKPCPLPLTSSWNQELVLLSPRYTLNDFPAQSEEVFVGPDGLCQITGFAR